MKQWQVWSEGYRATGEDAPARLEGAAYAETFAEACRIVCVEKGPWEEKPGGFDPIHLTVWGCQLFDNGADARRFNG
jgi:hypothetical protein